MARRRRKRKDAPNGQWLSALVLAGLLTCLVAQLYQLTHDPRAVTLRYREPAGPAVDDYLPQPPEDWHFRQRYFENAATLPVALGLPGARAWLAEHHQDWGAPQIDRNVAGRTLQIGGHRFAYGIGTHANSWLKLHVEGAHRLRGGCGLDDSAEMAGPVRFRIENVATTLFDSGQLTRGSAARKFAVDITGDLMLEVSTEQPIAGLPADWVDLRVD